MFTSARRNSPWMIGDPGHLVPQQQQDQQPQPRRGGIDIGQLGAMILATYGNPVGQMALQARQQDRQAARQAQLQQLQRQQSMQDRWSLWQRQQEFERNNPEPTDFERQMRAAGIDPGSEEGRNLYQQYVRNRANPIQAIDVVQPDQSVRREFIRPPMTPIAPLTTLPEGAVILDDEEEGGASPSSGSRPFR